MTMSPLEFIKKLVIEETQLDFMGHVNNATYLTLFEQARWDFVRSRGYGIDKIRASGEGPVVLQVDLKFQRELRLQDQITIRSSLVPWKGGKIMELVQVIEKQDGEIAATAHFKFGLFSLQLRKLVEPSLEWLYAVGIESSESAK